MEHLQRLSNLFFSLPTPAIKRYLFNHIDFEARQIGILGQRGVGKTTLLKQIAQHLEPDVTRMLYVSADNIHETLSEIAIRFSELGGELLIIDEIHKAPDFAAELKTIYDFTGIKVLFSGSSALQLEHAKVDLSRRALFYTLPSLSFREYIAIKTGQTHEARTLDELLENHVQIAVSLKQHFKPLELFSRYRISGAYPFFTEGEKGYLLRLNEIINIILDSEVAMIFGIDTSKIATLRKLLFLLCSAAPLQLNIQNLAKTAGISRNTLYNYLFYLQEAGLIVNLGAGVRNKSILNKPDKIYLDNINLYQVLCDKENPGSLRESFFMSQTKVAHNVAYHHQGDFIIDDRYVFEIGGKRKGFDQIKDVPDSFVVNDDVEIGVGNKIPLWLFGFLY